MDAKDLLNRCMGLMGREIGRLEQKEELLAVERESLCGYARVLGQMVGKDLGKVGDEIVGASDEELLSLIKSYAENKD